MSELQFETRVQDELETGKGFYLGFFFQKHELDHVRTLIRRQWLSVIADVAPEHYDPFSDMNMTSYHALSHLLDHAKTWPKLKRILPQDAIDYIRTTSLMKGLEAVFGDFIISDEENVGREEMYWRLVRPNAENDVGPLHADAWFWELDHGITPPNRKRVKVWIAIYAQPGLSGLRVVPDSQKKEWKYHGEYRDGFSKPQIDEDESTLSPYLVPAEPGDAIVFHDRLLHGGAINKGTSTRVSLEFTMFVKNQ